MTVCEFPGKNMSARIIARMLTSDIVDYYLIEYEYSRKNNIWRRHWRPRADRFGYNNLQTAKRDAKKIPW